MNKLIALVLCMLLISCKSVPEDKPTSFDDKVYQGILDSLFQSYPESVGIIFHIESPERGISWSGSAGHVDKEKINAVQPDQPALIASSIKTYVAATMLRLQEEGKLNINDPIGKYLTDETVALFTDDGYDLDAIEIRHLLSHTSGIADYVNDDYFSFINDNPRHRWTREEQMRLSTKVGDPLGKPQELFKYADVNFLLCTEIIEQLTGKPFYTAMRELLKYDELGLSHTWFPTLEETPPATPEMLHQYWNVKDFGPYNLDISWDARDHDVSWDLYGGGGIAASMEELAKFGYHLFNHDIIKDDQVLNLISTDVPTTDGVPKIYRLGIADPTVRGMQALGHGGFWGTMFLYIPALDASLAICVLEREGKMKTIKATLDAMVEQLTRDFHPLEDVVTTDDYALYKVKDARGTLVLYPGGGTTAEYTKNEFDILTAAAAQKISVVMMNFNRHLWIDDAKTAELADELAAVFTDNNMNTDHIYMGGMSIGGNIALTLSDYLKTHDSPVSPEGVFIIDSPIDLHALYMTAYKDTQNPDFDDDRLAEPKWILEHFAQSFSEDSIVQGIQKVSPFTILNEVNNVEGLKDTKVRFYTEPDSLWWKENRGTDFKSTNAYVIRQITERLKSNGWDELELIETENKGFRADGARHPHSWSIVDVRDLINWMTDTK